MKKIIFAVAFMLVFLGSVSDTSAKTCGDPRLNRPETEVFDGFATTTLQAIDNNDCSSAHPDSIVNPWGGTNKDVPKVKTGGVAVDEAGIVYECPFFYGLNGCVNITGTQYYKTRVTDTAKDLAVKGLLAQFPKMAYWNK
jgi:hypothetical protein